MSLGSWVVILLIVAVLFGTSKLKNIGKDVGAAIKGFKDGMQENVKEDSKSVVENASKDA